VKATVAALPLKEKFKPSILLSETHFHRQSENGVYPAALAKIAEEGYYEGVEIGQISAGTDRSRFREIVEQSKITVTQWYTFLIDHERLNISSCDENLRQKSVRRIKEQLYLAAECGARHVALISGPDPGIAMRQAATEATATSLCEICDEAWHLASLFVLIEPLDRAAHKNKLIGPTQEAVSLVRKVKNSCSNIGISWDTAHSALCGEDIFASLVLAKDHIRQMHLANAILERNDPGFGDHHRPLGLPGFLTEQIIGRLCRTVLDQDLFAGARPCLAAEVRTGIDGDPWQTDILGRMTIQRAWNLAVSGDWR
jgi:hydroxypyruvate isomerase